MIYTYYIYIYISYCSLTISCCCPTNFQLYTIISPLYTIIHTVFHYCIYYYISVILYRDIASFPFYITIYPYYLHYLPLHSQIFIIYHDIFSNFYHSNIFRMIPSFPLFIYIVYIYIHIYKYPPRYPHNLLTFCARIWCSAPPESCPRLAPAPPGTSSRPPRTSWTRAGRPVPNQNRVLFN